MLKNYAEIWYEIFKFLENYILLKTQKIKFKAWLITKSLKSIYK